MGPYIAGLKMVASVADILERELQPMIKDWLRRVNLVPALTKVPLAMGTAPAICPSSTST
jgi:hypothetical protein